MMMRKFRSEITDAQEIKFHMRWIRSRRIAIDMQKRQEMIKKSGPPDDLAKVASDKTTAELCAFYKVSRTTMGRWLRRIGIRPKMKRVPPPARPLPDDFAYQCIDRLLRREELYGHYRASGALIARWIRESGVRPARYCSKCIKIKADKDFASADTRTCRHCRAEKRAHPEPPTKIVARNWQRDKYPQLATPGLRYYAQGLIFDPAEINRDMH